MDRFVVCTDHFRKTDYRNAVSKCLNTTAIPHLHTKSFEPSKPEQLVNESIQTPKSDQTVKPEVRHEKHEKPEVRRPISPPEKPPYEIVILSTTPVVKEIYLDKVDQPHHVDQSQHWPTRTRQKRSREVDVDSNDAVLTKPAVPKNYASIKESKRKQSLKRIKVENDPILNSEFEIDNSIEIEVIDAAKVSEEIEMNQLKPSANMSTQTDESIEEKESIEIAEKYSKFKDYSKLTLVKELVEKEKQIAELQLKLEKFTVAMSAFKMLMNT